MIPVEPQPEPPDFDKNVRAKGIAWLEKNGIRAHGPLPPRTKPKAFWRDCLDDLYSAYGGVCAYLAVRFERATGSATVDHMIPKSLRAEAIYEWSNYRLATRDVNARKKDGEGILDPFTLKPDTFFIEFVTGSIYPNPSLPLARISHNTWGSRVFERKAEDTDSESVFHERNECGSVQERAWRYGRVQG